VQHHNERSRLAVPLALVLAVVLAILPTSAVLASTVYTVRSGDSLWKIANQHGTSVSALQSANGLRTTVIHPGQRLTIPGGSGGSGGRYTVQRGDSLWTIATRHGTTVAALQSANGLRTTEIRPGQTLVIPGGSSGGTTQATVAARSGAASLSASDIDLIARLVRSEAEAEPYAGQVAVAAVVLNRVRSSRFPNTVREVIYQRHQFEPVSNGRINLPAGEVHRRAARDAAAGWDPSGGALFFFNPRKTSNSFLHGLAVTTTIGGHRFAR